MFGSVSILCTISFSFGAQRWEGGDRSFNNKKKTNAASSTKSFGGFNLIQLFVKEFQWKPSTHPAMPFSLAQQIF